MAFEIIDELKRAAEGNAWTSPERLCVTAEGDVVNETDPRAVRLLVGKGGQLTKDEARHYGLLLEPTEKAEKPEGNKARKGTENKAAAPTEE